MTDGSDSFGQETRAENVSRVDINKKGVDEKR